MIKRWKSIYKLNLEERTFYKEEKNIASFLNLEKMG